FIAAAAAAEERRGGTALVASGDRDTFQLASAQTTILYPVRGAGLARVGAPGPATLLRKYGSLEKMLAAGRYPDHAEELRLYRSIATMDRKAPLPRLAAQKPTWPKAAALAR